jgi:hypothetical protein
LPGTADITGPIAWLSGPPHVGTSACATGARGKGRRDVARAWATAVAESTARTVLQKFSSRAASQCTTGQCCATAKSSAGPARPRRWPSAASNAAGRKIEKVLQIALRGTSAAPGQ